MSGFERATTAAVLLLILLLPVATAAADPVNRLAGHPSPYLALHGDDPVAWQEWNADALARARRENKLLFVSVGYFACHWCHVMQRESYRNPQIAALLNRDFIPVKVDRELNNGLDEALQDFSTRFNGVAGWPPPMAIRRSSCCMRRRTISASCCPSSPGAGQRTRPASGIWLGRRRRRPRWSPPVRR